MADLQEYTVTDKAGLYVAGVRVSVGQKIMLTKRQAAYEVARGTIFLSAGTPPDDPDPAVLPTDRIETRRGNGVRSATMQEVAEALLDASEDPNAARLDADNDFSGHEIFNARAPIHVYTSAHTLSEDAEGQTDKGAFIHMNSAAAAVVTLPNDWQPGDAAVIRQVGAGAVSWAFETGARADLPASRSTHTKIAERHGEIVVRVIANAGGSTAVYSISGETSE